MNTHKYMNSNECTLIEQLNKFPNNLCDITLPGLNIYDIQEFV
jgi:hypothetical protein